LKAYDALVRKWSKLCEGVIASLQEAGHDLLTFYHFPKSRWESLRTTIQTTRLNDEFRRWTKTQESFMNETAALVILWTLVVFGQVATLRQRDYHRSGLTRRSRYSPEVRERTARMVLDHQIERTSQWEAIRVIAPRIGCSAEALPKWARQAEVDKGRRQGMTSDEEARVRDLAR